MFKLILGGLLIALAITMGIIALVIYAPIAIAAVLLVLGLAVISYRN